MGDTKGEPDVWTSIQDVRWSRRNELVEHTVPAWSIQVGDVYQDLWIVRLAARVRGSSPQVMLLKLENMHLNHTIEMVHSDEMVVVKRLPEASPEAPTSTRPDTDIGEAPTLRPRMMTHLWEKSASKVGGEDPWTDWHCVLCNIRIRSRGDGKAPAHQECKGPSTKPISRSGGG